MSNWFSKVACWGLLALGLTWGGSTTARAQEKAVVKSDAAASAKATTSSDIETGTDTDATKAKTADADTAKPEVPKIETITFGGGCFWCLEAVFERLKGVKDVRSGYAGGDDSVGRPSYEMVCTGLTGHAEVVQVDFDPAIISYDDLLDVFWLCHDPTTLNSQGPDHGTQYRSIILYANPKQKEEAEKSYKKVISQQWYRSPIVTQVVPLTHFFPAEKYHQDYYRKNKVAQYCQLVISPKLRDVQAKLAKKAKFEQQAAGH